MTRRERARQRRHRRRVVGAGTAAVLVVLMAVVVGLVMRDGAESSATPGSRSSTTTTLPPAEPATIATAMVAPLEVRAEPTETAPAIASLEAVTDYGFPTTMLVESEAAESTADWLPVLVPLQKPNGTVGWVRSEQVAITETTYEIEIDLGDHELVLRNAGEDVLSTSVILGTPETPTPPGRFFVTDPVNCNEEHVPGYPVIQCDSAYGAFAIGISGLSEALDSFQGTIPQIAVHGTDLPDTELGKDVSNGCVRIPDGAVLEIARTTPLLGVPVTIVA